MDQLKRIQELTKELVELIQEIDFNNDETKKTYRYIVKRLPRTVLVEEEYKDEDYFFQGVSNLYTDYEFKSLSRESKSNLSLAFCFMKNNEAKVSLGFYTEPEIFRGSWNETLQFIFKRIEESSVFESLSEEKRNTLRQTMKVFAKK